MLDVTIPDTAKALPFDALHVGDTVRVALDVLAEYARPSPGLPPTWHFLPAGTHGKLLGFRDRDGESFGVVELPLDRKIVMYVREHKLVCVKHAPRPGAWGSSASAAVSSLASVISRRRSRSHR